MTATPWIDLFSPGLRFRPVTIPGSAPNVDLVRLHVDAARSASVSLVRFPAGWQRPGSGHFPCAEEFHVLRGELVVSGVRYAEGDYAYLPPRVTRTDSASPTGCLALAWFSGPPTWVDEISDLAPAPQSARRGPADACRRDPTPDVPGRSCVVSESPSHVDVPTELVSLSAWRWTLVHPGEPVPVLPGPIFLRTWEP